MARLTKAQRATLRHALAAAERALAYIDRPDIRVCATKRPEYALVGDFTRPPLTPEYREHCLTGPERDAPDYALSIQAKDTGSDLYGLRQAVRTLSDFLDAS